MKKWKYFLIQIMSEWWSDFFYGNVKQSDILLKIRCNLPSTVYGLLMAIWWISYNMIHIRFLTPFPDNGNVGPNKFLSPQLLRPSIKDYFKCAQFYKLAP